MDVKTKRTHADNKREVQKKPAARNTPRVEPLAAESKELTHANETAKRKINGNASGPRIGASEALSFLKETKGQVSWTIREMASTLKIGAKEAADAIAVLQIQGYVRPAAGSDWLTTPEGEAVAGAKSPRYARASVEQALDALKARMDDMNRHATQEYQVTNAVAFGDFLSERPQVQAADVGVQLAPRKGGYRKLNPDVEAVDSAVEQATQRRVLQKLRARTALLNLRPYEEWMSHRSHRKIV